MRSLWGQNYGYSTVFKNNNASLQKYQRISEKAANYMAIRYKINNLITKITLLLTIISSIALVGSETARYISPQLFWPSAFIGLAYVPLFLLNLLLLLLHSLRRKIIFLIPLIAILLGWNVMTDTFSLKSASSTETKDHKAIRLLTWNIHYFQDIYSRPLPESQKDMLATINNMEADVICIQEFYTGQDNDVTKGMNKIKAVLKKPYAFFQPMEGETRGMAVFSKYPIIRTGMIAFSTEASGNQCIFTDIFKERKTFRVYTVHLESIKLQSHQLNYIDSFVKGKERNIRPSKKIAGQLKRAFLERSDQVKLVKEHASTCPYPYIVCGDFNDPPSSYAFHSMSKGLKNTFAEKGYGVFPVTYYKGFLKYQIDHILVSPEFEVLNHQIVKKKISDHYPVLSDVKM